jgi:hypothetical protein
LGAGQVRFAADDFLKLADRLPGLALLQDGVAGAVVGDPRAHLKNQKSAGAVAASCRPDQRPIFQRF